MNRLAVLLVTAVVAFAANGCSKPVDQEEGPPQPINVDELRTESKETTLD